MYSSIRRGLRPFCVPALLILSVTLLALACGGDDAQEFAPDDESWELYDLGADPGETRNLYRPGHPQAVRLEPHLSAWLRAASPTEAQTQTVTERDREALEKLGYIE